jgi:hypothetical protein
VDKKDAGPIEAIRSRFNPEQRALIDSHVTLCREDEIEHIAHVLHNLQQIDFPAVTIRFGDVVRFDNGKGVLMPASDDNEAFHQLRMKVLEGLDETIRRPAPHITLMHPRNATCTDVVFEIIQQIELPLVLRFNTISLIDQIDGKQWQILAQFKLKDTK